MTKIIGEDKQKEEDKQKRINSFVEEYKVLSKKYGLDLQPNIQPTLQIVELNVDSPDTNPAK